MILNDDVQSQIGYELEQEQSYADRESARINQVHNGPVPVSMSLEDLAVIEAIFQGPKYAPTWAE